MIFTVFIPLFWQQLFIYLLHFINSCDSQTVGLICVNISIDFDLFCCKRKKCDFPKTSISCHIYLVFYSILCKQLQEFCDSLDTCHISFNLHLIIWFFLNSCTICNLQFRGQAYYRPRPTRQTSPIDHVVLFLSSMEALHWPDPSWIPNSTCIFITVTVIGALP